MSVMVQVTMRDVSQSLTASEFIYHTVSRGERCPRIYHALLKGVVGDGGNRLRGLMRRKKRIDLTVESSAVIFLRFDHWHDGKMK